MMGVFNNLVMFDQHVKQSSQESDIVTLAQAGVQRLPLA
jgi:hypothetical protein